MDHIDLFAMREQFNSQQILLCFNGPISRSLIEEIGNALRNYLACLSILLLYGFPLEPWLYVLLNRMNLNVSAELS